jgi:hypothetical protein
VVLRHGFAVSPGSDRRADDNGSSDIWQAAGKAGLVQQHKGRLWHFTWLSSADGESHTQGSHSAGQHFASSMPPDWPAPGVQMCHMGCHMAVCCSVTPAAACVAPSRAVYLVGPACVVTLGVYYCCDSHCTIVVTVTVPWCSLHLASRGSCRLS